MAATTAEQPTAKAVSGGMCNSWLVPCEGGGVVMVDVGVAEEYEGLKRALAAELGGTFAQQIKAVVLTHSHPDHAGAIAAFARDVPGARIIAHERAVEVVRAGRCLLEGRMPSRLTRVAGFFSGFRTGKTVAFPPLSADVAVVAGIEAGQAALRELGLANARLVATPGHTPDSISVVVGSSVFCGDAASNILNAFLGHLPYFITSDAEVAQSWELFRAIPDAVLFPGHGAHFLASALPAAAAAAAAAK